jgi:hypothetical protein
MGEGIESRDKDIPGPRCHHEGQPLEAPRQLMKNDREHMQIAVGRDERAEHTPNRRSDGLVELGNGASWNPPDPPLSPEIIESATLEKIFLDDLTVAEMSEWEGRERMRIMAIPDSSPYKLLSGNAIAYLEYTKRFGRIKNCIERFNMLQRSIEENGYPHGNEYICVYDTENIIRDGRHRAAILRYKWGNVEIPVIRFRTKVPFPRWEKAQARDGSARGNEKSTSHPDSAADQVIESGGISVNPLKGAEAFF